MQYLQENMTLDGEEMYVFCGWLIWLFFLTLTKINQQKEPKQNPKNPKTLFVREP